MGETDFNLSICKLINLAFPSCKKLARPGWMIAGCVSCFGGFGRLDTVAVASALPLSAHEPTRLPGHCLTPLAPLTHHAFFVVAPTTFGMRGCGSGGDTISAAVSLPSGCFPSVARKRPKLIFNQPLIYN